MAYIGNSPIIGNFQKCDALTASSTASYTLQVGGTNVSPESVNHMLVSLNGILQAPTTSFTVSGSTLTFASALTSSDSIDFVILLGNVLDLGVPSDDTVGAAQIKNDLISGTTALASEPDDTDEFLVSDAGTLKRIDYSLIKGGGITVADQWRLTASMTSNADITSNLERVDTSGQGTLGSAMTESSGIFTFPSTGIWWVVFTIVGQPDNSGGTVIGYIKATTNNSAYSNMTYGGYGSSDGRVHTFTHQSFIDVTDTSNVKVKFTIGSIANSDEVYGSSTENKTCMSFIRLGDT